VKNGVKLFYVNISITFSSFERENEIGVTYQKIGQEIETLNRRFI
jgi:hypothetical protein